MDEVTYHPEARKQIVQMLEAALTAFYVSMQQESFDIPGDTVNLSLMLEASEGAVSKLVAKSKDSDALLRTHALGILDHVKET